MQNTGEIASKLSYKKVSVNMIVRNGSMFIDEAMESLINQSHKPFEIIIINDASTDNTSEKLLNWQKKWPQIKIFQNTKHQGIPCSRNLALEHTSKLTDYIALLDADDISHPARLLKQVQFLETHPDYDIVGSQIQLINSTGHVVGQRKYPVNHQDILKTLPISNPFCQSTVMLRNKSLKPQLQYNTNYSVCEDYQLWCDLLKNKKAKNLSENLVQYRIKSPQQITQRKTHLVLKNILILKRKLLSQSSHFSVHGLIYYFLQYIALYLPKSLILYFRNFIYFKNIQR